MRPLSSKLMLKYFPTEAAKCSRICAAVSDTRFGCRNTEGGPAALPANQAGHHLHHHQPVVQQQPMVQPVATGAPVM